jgi:hypothetical protein
MKRKVLCIALALLMCMMVSVPTFAEISAETPPERAPISATFGLKHISESTYKMWAKINNPLGVSVFARLTLYNVSYSPITSVSTTSTYTTISLSQNVTLSSGTYHLILTITADGQTHSYEKTYTI